MKLYPALALTFALAAAPALAQQFKAGDIVVEKAWAPGTPKGAEVGAGYFAIHNNGATADKLTGGSADFAKVEIHATMVEDGVMKMPELKQGLNIPAHATIRFAPGGYHVMFAHLTKPLVKGDKVKATLTFEHVGPIEVEFPVEAIGASGPAPSRGGGMGGMKM